MIWLTSPAREEISVMYATDCSVASENNDNYVRVPKSLNLDKLIYAPNAADKLSNNYQKVFAIYLNFNFIIENI